MIKTIGCLMILGASTIGGLIYSEGFKKRVRQLNEFERAIGQLQSEIEYTYTPLPEALSNVSLKSEAPINKIFMKASKLLYSNKVETVYEAFQRCFNDGDIFLNLNKEDISVILDLSKSLGESDIEAHKKFFSLAKNNIKKRISIAETVANKNVRMYRYLGFSIGAMIVIVLI